MKKKTGRRTGVARDGKRRSLLRSRSGMEMVQVAILVAIAVALGLIFKEQITEFVNNTFKSLSSAKF